MYITEAMIDRVTDSIRALLKERAQDIESAMAEYMTQDQSGKPHKFNVAIRLTVKPRGETCDAAVKVSYGVKKVAETDCATPTGVEDGTGVRQ